MPDCSELLRRQKALADFGDFVLDHDDLQQVLDEGCRLVAEALGADLAKVLEIERTNDTALVRAGVGWRSGIVGRERVSLSERSSEAFAIEHAEPVITNDIAHEERFHFPSFLRDHGVVALVNVPIFLPGRRPWGVLQVDAREIREFEQEDIEFLKTYSMVLGPVIDRLRHVRGRQESEAKYRTLFESIEEGLAVVEMIYDDNGEITDMIFRDVNSAYERQTGIGDAVGRSIYDIIPDVEDYWIDAYRTAARTGEAVRLERYQRDVDMWFDVHFTRIDHEGRFVAIVFSNTTVRKRAEAQLRASEDRKAFLLKLADTLRAIPADRIVEAAVDMLAEKLGLDLCYAVTVSPEEDRAEVVHQWRRSDMPALPQTIRLSDFPRSLSQWQERTLVSRDMASDPDLTEAERRNVVAMGFGALIAAPVRRGSGNPIWSLNGVMAQARRWTSAEIALVEETAERTWAAVEQARTDRALLESEERQRFLLSLSDRLRDEPKAERKIEIAARLLGERLQASRVLWAEYDWERKVALIFNGWFADGARPFPASMNLDDYAGPVLDELRAGRTVRIDDVGAFAGDPAYDKIADIGVQALLSPPLLVDGLLKVNLSIHQHEPRQWTDAEVALVRDVADRLWSEVVRTRAEAVLRESEERFRRFGEASQDILWMRDSETLQWTYLTPAFEAIYGLSREEAVEGQNYLRWLDLVVPEDRERAEREIGKVRTGERVTFEYRIRRPTDGTIRWLRETSFPVSNDAGSMKWIAGIAHNVTQLHESEERRRTSEQRLGLIVENTPDYAIFTTDLEGRIDRWYDGAAAVFGWTAEEAIGQLAEITFTPEDRAAGKASEERACAAQSGRALDVRWHLRKDGTRIFIDGVATALRDANGALTGFLKIGQDVTERRRAEELQGTLLAELQHRVRNLLAMIRSVVRRASIGKDSVRDFVDHLEGRIDAMARTQAMLTRSPGRDIDLQAIVEEELLAQGADPRHYRIKGPATALNPKVAEVITLAIHELTTNSVKYGALGRHGAFFYVTWSKEQRGPELWLTICWREKGVAIEGEPKSGFGTELLTRRVPFELGGEATLDFQPDGLCATLELPLGQAGSVLQTDAIVTAGSDDGFIDQSKDPHRGG